MDLSLKRPAGGEHDQAKAMPTLEHASAASDDTELELKFAVPAAHLTAITTELNLGQPAKKAELQAHYFDTPDDRLAGAGLSLRLRQNDGRWFQTLKMKAAWAMCTAPNTRLRSKRQPVSRCR